jgi:pimeloyl-ACP methyl ester carboxylesterase
METSAPRRWNDCHSRSGWHDEFLHVPFKQVHGTPPDMARRLHQHVPGSSLSIIPSAAHRSNVEQPENLQLCAARIRREV